MIAGWIRNLRTWNRRRYIARIMKTCEGADHLCLIKGREAMIERILFGDNIAFEDK